jgi:hypothetical protein
MPGEEFNPDYTHLSQVGRVRSQADSLIQLEYTANTTQAVFAHNRAEVFTEAVARLLSVDSSVDPAIPKLRGAFTKLIFTFTNPEDHDDTIASYTVIELVNDFLGSATYAGKTATSQLLADYLDVLTSSMFLVEQNLRAEGVFEGLTAQNTFAVVEAWLELAAQPETDEPPTE